MNPSPRWRSEAEGQNETTIAISGSLLCAGFNDSNVLGGNSKTGIARKPAGGPWDHAIVFGKGFIPTSTTFKTSSMPIPTGHSLRHRPQPVQETTPLLSG